MHNLIDFICDEMEELERKVEKDGKISAAELQYLDTLAHTKKNLLKADEMWEESEYSNAGDSYARGGSYRSMDGSYARGGDRGRGANARRDSMGRYSREGYSRGSDFKSDLRDLMESAPTEHARQTLHNLMSEM